MKSFQSLFASLDSRRSIRESGIWQEADSCAKITKFLGLNILSAKTAKYRHLLLLGPKISVFYTFSPIGPRSSTVFWTNTTYCALVTEWTITFAKRLFLSWLCVTLPGSQSIKLSKNTIILMQSWVGQQDYFWIFTSRHFNQSSISNPDMYQSCAKVNLELSADREEGFKKLMKLLFVRLSANVLVHLWTRWG